MIEIANKPFLEEEITHQMTVEEEKEMYRDLYNNQEATNQKLLNENKELKEEIAFLKRVIGKFI